MERIVSFPAIWVPSALILLIVIEKDIQTCFKA